MIAVPDITGCRVLIVDDDVVIQQMLIADMLQSMGITDLVFAEDGIAGLEAARANPPDLIILDIVMPRMDGFEMLKRLKREPALAGIPVIVQSGMDSVDNRDQMFDCGASDFVSKPLHSAEFQGRVGIHLRNAALVRELQGQLDRVAQELASAAEVQRQQLPSPAMIEKLERDLGLRLDFRFEPSSELGGDFWGIVPSEGRAVGIYICDFAGHGVSSALNTIRLHTLIREMGRLDPNDPASFVGQLNSRLIGQMDDRQFATFLMAAIDVEANRIVYSAAGAPHPVLRLPDGAIRLMDGRGMPLGLADAIPYENRLADFPEGSGLLLYSDAMSESADEAGALIGTEGVAGMVAATLPDREALPNLLAAFAARAPRRSKDDLTAVWLARVDG